MQPRRPYGPSGLRVLPKETQPLGTQWKDDRDGSNSVPHCARRISVGSVRNARSTAGRVATRAVSRMAHVGEAIMSASVALTC